MHDDPKLRKPKKEPEPEPDFIYVQSPAHFLTRSPQTVTVPGAPVVPRGGYKNRAQAAETYARAKYGRSREEIDSFIPQHFPPRGPTWVSRQLGMKRTTVTMRARKLGL